MMEKMRAYTVVVDSFPAGDGSCTATVSELPGLTIPGDSSQECLEKTSVALSCYLEDVAAAHALRPTAESGGRPGPAGSPAAAPRALGDEEALDAVQRAMAALHAIQTELETELARRPNPSAEEDLRRAHVALLQAEAALVQAHDPAAAPAAPGWLVDASEETP